MCTGASDDNELEVYCSSAGTCVCVCVCVRAHARVCVCVCSHHSKCGEAGGEQALEARDQIPLLALASYEILSILF